MGLGFGDLSILARDLRGTDKQRATQVDTTAQPIGEIGPSRPDFYTPALNPVYSASGTRIDNNQTNPITFVEDVTTTQAPIGLFSNRPEFKLGGDSPTAAELGQANFETFFSLVQVKGEQNVLDTEGGVEGANAPFITSGTQGTALDRTASLLAQMPGVGEGFVRDLITDARANGLSDSSIVTDILQTQLAVVFERMKFETRAYFLDNSTNPNRNNNIQSGGNLLISQLLPSNVNAPPGGTAKGQSANILTSGSGIQDNFNNPILSSGAGVTSEEEKKRRNLLGQVSQIGPLPVR